MSSSFTKMMLTFCKSQLQFILTIARQSQEGRKSDLQVKVMNSLHLESVREKIVELYDLINDVNIIPEFGSYKQYAEHLVKKDGLKFDDGSYFPIPPPAEIAPLPEPTVEYPDENAENSELEPKVEIDVMDSELTDLPGFASTKEREETKIVSENNDSSVSSIVPAPGVTLCPFPFYKNGKTLLGPIALNPPPENMYPCQEFSFTLSPETVKDIEGRRLGQGTCHSYKKRIILRFCHLDDSCPQRDNVPEWLIIKVNGVIKMLPKGDTKKIPRPIDITALCKLTSFFPNYVSISWKVEDLQAFTVSLYCMEKLTAFDLLQELLTKEKCGKALTKTRIKTYLLKNSEDDMETSSCKITLTCPISQKRMRYPCRASSCSHFQCFDALSFLMIAERNGKWICPLCRKPVVFGDLALDEYFQEILDEITPDNESISIFCDGSWVVCPNEMGRKRKLSIKKSDSFSDCNVVKGNGMNSCDSVGPSRKRPHLNSRGTSIEIITLSDD